MKHFPQFDVLRGFAALWVFASHVLLICGLHVPLLSNGIQAVDLFVILSGFVIALLRLSSPERYGAYIFRRFVRLYPLFLVALLLGWATTDYYAAVLGNNPWIAGGEYLSRSSDLHNAFWQHLVAHLTMLHGAIPEPWLPESVFTFAGPLWSISLEWQFYLVAPVLVYCLDWRHRPWVAVLAAAVMIVAARMLAQRYWPSSSVPAFLPQRLELFALGMGFAIAWEWARRTSALKLALFALATALVFAEVLDYHKAPLAIWLAVYLLAAADGRHAWAITLNRGVKAAWARWIGERSYGLYVLHMPIVLTVAHLVVMPYAAQLQRGKALVALVGLALPLVLAIAALCYRFVEKPTIGWAKRLAKAPATATDSGIAPAQAARA